MHDVCSAVHPMALASPFFRAFELARRVRTVVPELSFGSPLDGGRAALAYHSLDRTAARTGAGRRAPTAGSWPRSCGRMDGVMDLTQHQLLRIPRDPVAAAALRPADAGAGLAAVERAVQGGPGSCPAQRCGRPCRVATLPSLAAAGAGLMLGALAHAQGWPIPRGRIGGDRRRAGRRHRSPRRGDPDREAGRARSRSCRRPGPPCWTWRRPGCCAMAGRQAARQGTAGPWSRSASGTVPARWTSSCPGRCRGQPRAWPTPEPCTWAAPVRRWPTPRT